MALFAPLWLLLLVPLLASLMFFRLPTRMLRLLRGTVFVLIVLALARPALHLPSKAGCVVVVADRSASLPADATARETEMIGVTEAGMHGANMLGVVAFGARTAVEQQPQHGRFNGFVNDVGSDRSELCEGLDRALSLLPKDAPARIVVISDGRFTGADPGQAAARAATRGIAIDYRVLERPPAQDLAIRDLVAPRQVAPRETLFLTAWVVSPVRSTVSFELTRSGTKRSEGSRVLEPGLNRFMFSDTAPEGGTMAYVFRVSAGPGDPVLENNSAKALVQVAADKPLLCVAPNGESGLAGLLKRGGLNVVARAPGECSWSLDTLASYSSVIVEDTPANSIGTRGMETLAAWVQHAGAGLMFSGGAHAYGCGGYFKSPLDPIMPVSMQMRQESRKFRVAIAIALDRSGSMGCPVGGGKTKIDLANIGVVQVLDMLGDQDEIGVIAVDNTPYYVVEMGSVASARPMRSKILSIRAENFGIFIYEALSCAAKMLNQSSAQNRHIVLFADAAHSIEPGAYQNLLRTVASDNVTVSVIGLGSATDCDAHLLEDIARIGGGDVFFTQDPFDIPRLFAQDMITVSRSSFVETQTVVRALASYPTVARGVSAAIPPLGGYNLSYIKPGADAAVLSVDEFIAPIIASWRAGNGRVLCYLGQADGPFSGPVAQWEHAGSLFSSLARWTAGTDEGLPNGCMLAHRVRSGQYRIELHLDPDRTADPFPASPAVSLLHGAPGVPPAHSMLPMTWESADMLAAEAPIGGSETMLATVVFSSNQQASLPPVCLPYSPEFAPGDLGKGAEALHDIAAATGGRERTDLRGVWRDLPRRPRWFSIAPCLLLAAALVFLLEIFERRTGMLSLGRTPAASAVGSAPLQFVVKLLRRRSTEAPAPAQQDAAQAATSAVDKPTEQDKSPTPSAPPPKAKTEKPKTSTLDAIKRARDRASRRMGGSG